MGKTHKEASEWRFKELYGVVPEFKKLIEGEETYFESLLAYLSKKAGPVEWGSAECAQMTMVQKLIPLIPRFRALNWELFITGSFYVILSLDEASVNAAISSYPDSIAETAIVLEDLESQLKAGEEMYNKSVYKTPKPKALLTILRDISNLCLAERENDGFRFRMEGKND